MAVAHLDSSLRTTHCLVCRAPGPYAPVFDRDGHHLVRCPQCRLVFQDPQASDASLEETYYHAESWTAELLGPLEELTLERARQQLARMRAFGVVPGGRLLDIGASSGSWLRIAEEAGWQGVGVELGATTAEAARGRGLDVRTGTLDAIAPTLEAGSFDAVTFWDVLEHLRDPRVELGIARDLLRPGGTLAAAMPNVEGWFPRASRRLLASWSGHWEYPELPVHLYDFSPRTMERLLVSLGFVDVRTTTYETPWWYYQRTSIALGRVGHGRRGRLIRAAYEALHAPLYPLARLADAGNSFFVTARVPD